MNKNTFNEIYVLIDKIPTEKWTNIRGNNGYLDSVVFEKEDKTIKIFCNGALRVDKIGQDFSRSQKRKFKKFYAHVESELAAIAVHDIVRSTI